MVLYACTKVLDYIARQSNPLADKIHMSFDIKAIIQNIIIALLIAVGLFCSILLLSFSWVKITAIIVILVPGGIALVTHGLARKIFKYIVIATLIFAISFTSIEASMLWNASYPTNNVAAPKGVTVEYPSVLNVSLTKLIDGIEGSPTYALLTAEHGKTTPEMIWLNTEFRGGEINIGFYGQDSNTYYGYSASQGYQYHVQVGSYSGTLYSTPYMQSSAKQAFQQIDALGLQWFYSQALDAAQNKTGSKPQVDALSLTIGLEGYDHVTLLIIGSHNGAGDLICDFEPNGKLNYMTQPQ